MKITPRAHLIGLIAMLWAGKGLYYFLIDKNWDVGFSTAIWSIILALLLLASWLVQQKDQTKRIIRTPITKTLLGLFYLVAAIFIGQKSWIYIEEGYLSHAAGFIFSLGFTWLAFGHFQASYYDFKNENHGA